MFLECGEMLLTFCQELYCLLRLCWEIKFKKLKNRGLKTGAERLSNTELKHVHPVTEASKTQVRTEAGTNADHGDPVFGGGRAQAIGSCWMWWWEAGIWSLPRVWEHQSCICIMVQANIRSGWASKQVLSKGSFAVGGRLTSQVKKKKYGIEMSVYLLMHKFFERIVS